MSSAIKPFTSWDLPSCPARLVSIFQQQMHVLHNHSSAELQGDGTVRQDGKRVKKDVAKTRNNTTFHVIHCMLVRIVPSTTAGWGRIWRNTMWYYIIKFLPCITSSVLHLLFTPLYFPLPFLHIQVFIIP